MGRKLLIAVIALLGVWASPAAAQYDYIVTPGEVLSGGKVSVSGQGCSPGAEVTIFFAPAAETRAAGQLVATVTADANGEFTATFDVPAGTVSGIYSVSSFCDGAQVGSQDIEVLTETTTPSTTPNQGDGDIVRTGSDVAGLGVLAVALLGLGGFLMLAAKGGLRRRTA